MKRVALVAALLVVVPALVWAKTPHLKGFQRVKGTSAAVSEPLGWPIAIDSSSRVNATLSSLPGMSIVRLAAYKPWWQPWASLPATSTVTISGLPKSTLLHIYKQGYRVHLTATTTQSGTLTLPFRSRPGDQFIIKPKPSTWHIAIQPFLGAKGGDCSSIGSWNATTNTCTLSGDVYQTITIDDNGITLDGNGKSVRGANSGDGVYTDQSNVHITHIEVHNFDRGIVFQDSLFTFANGGQVDRTVTSGNILNIYDEGVSNLTVTDNDIVASTAGLSLVDQLDGFPTDGIKIVHNNFKLIAQDDFFNSGTSFVLDTATERGNWWQKDTNCTQDPNNSNHCTNAYNSGYGTDNAPWACESAWRTGITCPGGVINPPPPPPTTGNWGEVTSAGISPEPLTATLYLDGNFTTKLKELPNGWSLELIDPNADPIKVRDTADNLVGYVDSNRIKIYTDTSNKSRLESAATLAPADTKSERIGILGDAVAHYWSETSTAKNLYSGNDYSAWDPNSKSNISFNSSLVTDGQFPRDLYLAALIEENGGTVADFDNTLITFDYGHAPGQLTVAGYQKDVSYLQLVLRNIGYSTVVVNGRYDATTSTAIKQFQADKSLTQTGDVGPVTLGALNAYLNSHRSDTGLSTIPNAFSFRSFLTRLSHDRTTGTFDNRAGVVGLVLYPCSAFKTSTDALAANNYKNCYAPSGQGLHYKPIANAALGTPLMSYYQNTKQSLYASVKNGLSVLLGMYAQHRTNVDRSTLSRPWLASGSLQINDSDLKAFLALRGYNGFGTTQSKITTTEGNIIPCIKYFDNSTIPGYLLSVANDLVKVDTVFPNAGHYDTTSDLYKKLVLVNKNRTEVCIGSPAYLQIFDNQGVLTGFDGTSVKEGIYNAVYDEVEHEHASILIPNGTYHFRVVGTDSGTYDFVVANYNNSEIPVLFKATLVPISKGVVYDYYIDWTKLTATTGVTVKIDQNGDGAFEKTIEVGRTITGDILGLSNSQKQAICHMPPGNAENAHTLYLPQAAIKAHLAHGDKLGECATVRNGDKENDLKEINNLETGADKHEGKDDRSKKTKSK